MDAETQELYQEMILDHDARPRNYGALETASHRANCYNPICGDSYSVFIHINEDRIETICFTGHGCVMSKASLSMMTVALAGKTVAESLNLFARLEDTLLQKTDLDEQILGDLSALVTVRHAPARLKCALLGWEAMREALQGSKGPV